MKRALITGASSGIGLHFAKTLKKRGWEVFGVARSEDKLKETFGEGNYLSSDLSSDDGIAELVEHLASAKYELLINNAGYGIYGRFDKIDIQDELNMMNLNMNALVRISYAYLKTAKRGDALMNISSVLSLLPMPGAAVYSATKSFVTSFTECLWHEYQSKGVYIFADLPGAVSTDFHKNAGSSTDAMDPKMTLTPDTVVQEALATLEKRKDSSILNGTQYRILAKMAQLLPRKTRLEQMAKNSPNYKS